MRLVAVIALLVWIQGCITINTAPEPNRIQKSEVDRLKTGMSYNDIERELGVEGKWLYKPDDFGNAVAEFEDSYGASVTVQFKELRANIITPSGVK